MYKTFLNGQIFGFNVLLIRNPGFIYLEWAKSRIMPWNYAKLLKLHKILSHHFMMSYFTFKNLLDIKK